GAALVARQVATRGLVDAPVTGPGEDVRVVAAPVLAHPALEITRGALAQPDTVAPGRHEGVGGLVKVRCGTAADPGQGQQHRVSVRPRDGDSGADDEPDGARASGPFGKTRAHEGLVVRL